MAKDLLELVTAKDLVTLLLAPDLCFPPPASACWTCLRSPPCYSLLSWSLSSSQWGDLPNPTKGDAFRLAVDFLLKCAFSYSSLLSLCAREPAKTVEGLLPKIHDLL